MSTLVAKIVLYALSVAVTYFCALLDYRHHDKRTTKFKRGRAILLKGILPLMLMGGSLLVWQDEVSHNTELAEHKKAERSLQESVDTLNNGAIRSDQRAIDLSSQMAAMVAEQKKTNTKLDPFLVVARHKYPGRPDDEALTRLAEEVTHIRSTTERLKKEATTVGVDRLASILSTLESVDTIASLRAANEGRNCFAEVGSLYNDSDAGKLQNSLILVLARARWNVGPGFSSMPDFIWRDARMRISQAAPTQCMMALARVLANAGLKVERMIVQGPVDTLPNSVGAAIEFGVIR